MIKNISGLVVIIAFLFSACQKMPTACLTTDKTNIDMGSSISFTSCATEAEKITWDFGDGSKGEGASTNHPYSKPGTYLVTMNAFSKKDKKWDKISTVITVNDTTPIPMDYFLKSVTLKSFPVQNNGVNWDGPPTNPGTDGPEPEINVVLATVANTWNANLGTIANAQQQTYSMNLEPYDYKFTDTDWKLVLTDVGVDGDVTLNRDPQPMQTLTFNPYTLGIDGKINVSLNGYELELEYTERPR